METFLHLRAIGHDVQVTGQRTGHKMKRYNWTEEDKEYF